MRVPEYAVEWRFFAASGPGGQHVNKVATAAMLRFDTAVAGIVGERLVRLAAVCGRRMGKDGVVVIVARRYRSQEQNKEDALARLEALLRASAQVPKVRRATKATKASRERRLEGKKVRSEVKATRAKVR